MTQHSNLADINSDPSRLAAARSAALLVNPNTTIGLGSGRAVFALTALIRENLGPSHGVSAVVASPEAEQFCAEAGIEIASLDAQTTLDFSFDGADEIDPQFRMIKGHGAALLREKFVLSAGKQKVILIQADKQVAHLGETKTLPVEVTPFAWQRTQKALSNLLDDPALRTNESGEPVVTANGNLLLDGGIHTHEVETLASEIKKTLGVIDHGLFFDQCDKLIIGHPDGSSSERIAD